MMVVDRFLICFNARLSRLMVWGWWSRGMGEEVSAVGNCWLQVYLTERNWFSLRWRGSLVVR